MESTVKKTKFVWSIILCIISLAPIVFAICLLVKLLATPEFNLDTLVLLIFCFLLGFGMICGAHFLYASYSEARGEKSAAGKAYYWLTIIFSVPFFIVAALISLIIFILIKIKRGMDKWAATPSSSSGERNNKYTITVNGFKRDIEWDRYTKTYRDSSGNHYVTKDGGKTFSPK